MFLTDDSCILGGVLPREVLSKGNYQCRREAHNGLQRSSKNVQKGDERYTASRGSRLVGRLLERLFWVIEIPILVITIHWEF